MAVNCTPDYKLQAVGANIAQLNGFNGAGIGVAIIDSGITNRPDLRSSNVRFHERAQAQLQAIPVDPG